MLILKTFGGIVQYYVGDLFQDAKKDKKKPTSAKKGDEKDKSKDKGRTAFLPNKQIFTARKRSLGQGNFFTPISQSFCSPGGGGTRPLGRHPPQDGN